MASKYRPPCSLPIAQSRTARAPGQFLGYSIRRQPLGAAGGVIVVCLILVAVWAGQLAPYHPKEAILPPYHAPTRNFLLGTDHLGRDIFSRLLWGARLSLYVGLVSVTVGISLGSLWGIVTGYYGGTVDNLSQRVVDTLMAFPPLILALGLMAVLQQSVHNVIITLAILLIPTAARTLRSTTLSLKEMGYVESARALGATNWRIIFGHILPNSLATYIVLFTVNVAYALLSKPRSVSSAWALRLMNHHGVACSTLAPMPSSGRHGLPFSPGWPSASPCLVSTCWEMPCVI